MHAWVHGYDSRGHWQPALAKAALTDIRRVRRAEEARRKEAKEKAKMSEKAEKQKWKEARRQEVKAAKAAATPTVVAVGQKRGLAATSSGSRKKARVAPYSEHELEVEVESALTLLFAGDRDDCSVDELFAHLGKDPRAAAAGRDALTQVLNAMEAANKLMHREGHVYFI